MTSHKLISWVVGLIGVSLFLGSICTWAVYKKLHGFFKSTANQKNWEVKWNEAERIPVYPVLIGVFERVFFTVMVAFDISGVGVAIVSWMLIKMATGWNRISGSGETWRRMLAFTGLLCSMTSLFFAVLGGLIANGSIPLQKISFGELEQHRLVQVISITFTLIGTFMVAFGYRSREGISTELRKQLEIDRLNLIVPTDIKKRPWLFYGGLILLGLATIVQVLLVAGY